MGFQRSTLFLSLSAVDVSTHFKGVPGRARRRGRGPVDIRRVVCIVLQVHLLYQNWAKSRPYYPYDRFTAVSYTVPYRRAPSMRLLRYGYG
ncbi:uncharacterized protein ARMOST_07593 [Armillaria ostoyae]|uniref:Uncharacterized protein n=1 Tax=Armillaria ostoyae TaxID=47428 RepID=A0A284R6C5_ARMOS|nr:uncharacterized protein ARMOST_07593 [Armillaria ostoyae]